MLHKETSDNPKSREIVQNIPTSISQNCQDHEKLGSCHRWKEVKETKQPQVTWYPGIVPEPKKDSSVEKVAKS